MLNPEFLSDFQRIDYFPVQSFLIVQLTFPRLITYLPFTAAYCYVTLMPGLEKPHSVTYVQLLQCNKADQRKEDCLVLY